MEYDSLTTQVALGSLRNDDGGGNENENRRTTTSLGSVHNIPNSFTCWHALIPIWYSMSTYQITDSPLKRSTRRSFATLRKSRRNHPSLRVNRRLIWYGFRAGAKAFHYSVTTHHAPRTTHHAPRTTHVELGNSSNDEGDVTENGKKATGLEKQNNNFHVHLAIKRWIVQQCEFTL